MTQIDERAPVDIATDAVVETRGGVHNRACAWHAVMANYENWYETQGMDPSAEWCQGDPDADYLAESALDLIDSCCRCDHT